MMGLELYLDLLSQPCRAVYLFARKNRIPFEMKDVELFKDSILGTKQLSDPHAGAGLAQQPEPKTKVTLMKKVPVLKEGDFILSEGTAILLYLSRRYETPDHWYPSDPQKRARVDEYLAWHQSNLRAHAPRTLWLKVLIPLFTDQGPQAEKLEEAMEGLQASLGQLEETFLGEQPFLAGEEISLADLMALVELMQPVGVGCDIFQGRPRLSAWRDRVEAFLGQELFLQAHERILNVRQLSTLQMDPRLKEQLAPLLLKVVNLAMVLELYLDLLSQPSRAVYIFAKKNNIPFVIKSIEMLKGQLFSEEFNKVNILRKVPVLKDGDFTLEESTAILLYLTRKYNTPSHWYPPDMKKRARVDEYLAWQHTNIRTTASKILWLKVVIPLFLGQQIPQEKLQDAMEDLGLSLQKLEEKFLQDKPFIIGNEISLADLVAIVELMQPMGAGWDVFEGRPKLQEWRKRVEVTLGKELFMEAHARILNTQELRSITIDPPLKAQMKPILLKMLK